MGIYLISGLSPICYRALEVIWHQKLIFGSKLVQWFKIVPKVYVQSYNIVFWLIVQSCYDVCIKFYNFFIKLLYNATYHKPYSLRITNINEGCKCIVEILVNITIFLIQWFYNIHCDVELPNPGNFHILVFYMYLYII